jgi:hypothetical protein
LNGELTAQELPALRAAIPDVVSPDHRHAITDRLRYLDEFSASQRLKALFTEHLDALRASVDDPVALVRPILTHRNASHTSQSRLSTGTGDPKRVLRYNFALRRLLEACFLKIVGFTSDEIGAFARRSEMYRPLKVQIFHEGTTLDPEAGVGSGNSGHLFPEILATSSS